MKDLFSALLAPFFVIVNVVALFFLLAACPVVIAVAASATKERAYLKHDGFVARLQRAEAMAANGGKEEK